MAPSSQSNKATPNSDFNHHNSGTTTTTDQLISPQQEAEVNSNKLQLLEQDVGNSIRDGQKQRMVHQEVSRHRRRGQSLRAKATAMALALGTLPILIVGATAYYFANQSITEQIVHNERNDVVDLEDRLEFFIRDRYIDIQALAALDTFTNAQLREATTREQKEALLSRYVKDYQFYDSIAVFDVNGNIVAQSKSPAPEKGNYSNQKYFQQVLSTQRPIISEPTVSKSSGKLSIEIAAPIKDDATGKLIGVMRSRLPVDSLDYLFDAYTERNEEFFLIDGTGKIFQSNNKESVGKTFREEFPQLFAQKQATGDEIVTVSERHETEARKELASYAPTKELREAPYQLNWGTVISLPTDVAFAPQRQLLLALLLGTGLTALVVSAIAAYLASRATRPILAATGAVEKLSQGELDTRIAVAGEDEIAMLGSNINRMAGQLQTLITSQKAEVERSRILKEIIVRLGEFPQSKGILDAAVEEIRLALKTDRVVVYSFNEKWQGTVTAESVAEGWPNALGAEIDDPCFAQQYVERYRQGRVQATENIHQAGLNSCYLKQLEAFAVKANLVAPIVLGSHRQLLGLLIAHQCDSPRAWQQGEIDLFAQLATQVGYALDRANLLEQQRTAKEQLQKRALELLMEVEPISKGDLTIRANVTEDEIGTIADSYNATVGSLRQIVNQVQAAAKLVATTTTSSEASVSDLSIEALRQTQEITAALDRIQEMSNSIRAVAANAQQAEAAVVQATQTVEAGDAAMNRTVNGILAIRETVAQTSKKVQRLGEASQKISKVVKLISTFADQTNLLALNAAIEAARAGEEGRGFAVIADEVQSLALQSFEATAEIESLVSDIQTETNSVVAAMEAGTQQVVEGTQLVDETRTSLNKITAVSAQISALVEAIAQATVAQSQASESVTQTMTDVAAIALQTSTEATQVSASFQELLAVASELQDSAAKFKVK